VASTMRTVADFITGLKVSSVNSGALSETPEDPTGLVAIKGPVSTELVCEDPHAGDNIGALRSGNQLSGPIAD
jgi:hypothetical protein